MGNSNQATERFEDVAKPLRSIGLIWRQLVIRSKTIVHREEHESLQEVDCVFVRVVLFLKHAVHESKERTWYCTLVPNPRDVPWIELVLVEKAGHPDIVGEAP